VTSLAHDLAGALDPTLLAGKAGLILDEWQAEALRRPVSKLALNVHRQGGKSTVAGIMGLADAVYHPGALVLIVSPSQRQSGELFRKVSTIYRAIGRPVESEQENALSMALENGSRVVSLPGTEVSVRGFSAPRTIIIDEAARVEDAMFRALSPMMAVAGPEARIIAMSTPWGRRGWFYEATNDPSWTVVTVKATECKRISASFLEGEHRSIGDLWYRSEYLCEFLDPAGMMFSSEDIAKMFDGSPLGSIDWPAPFGIGPAPQRAAIETSARPSRAFARALRRCQGSDDGHHRWDRQWGLCMECGIEREEQP
jgi:hypothetical protein